MLIRKLLDSPAFTAGDGTILRELLHPGKAELALRYSLAHASLNPAEISQWHTLASSEVYYILSGRGLMEIEHESKEVVSGDTVYIPPHAKQRIKNIGTENLEFLCIVDPAWQPEDEKVL